MDSDNRKSGSGSSPNDFKVVANEETVQADQVHVVRFGEGERFADQTSKALSEGVVEALNMSRKAGAFANSLVLSIRQHGSVSFPEVAVKDALPVTFSDGLPKLLTSSLTSPTHDTSDHLPCTFTQRQPYPASVAFVTDKRPQFIEFEHNLFRLIRQEQRVFKGWQRRRFF